MGKELEMIEKFIYKYKTSELYLKYLYQLEEFYLLSNDFTRAFRIIGKGLKLSRQLMNVQMEAEFQFVLTRNCNANGKIKDSIKEAKKLLVVSEENNFKNLYYWANYFMASNFQLLGNYAQSNLIIERSLYEININGYSQLVKNFINLKGKCFFLKGDYRSFITILKDLYKIERNDGSMHAAIVTLLNLANCLIMINEFNEARFIFNKIQTFMQKSESPLFLKRVTEGFFNLYLREDDYQRAEHISVQLLNLYGKNDYRNLALLHSNLIIIYSCLNKPKEYKKNYLRAIYYEKKTGHVSGTIVCHYNIGNAYYLSGQVTEAERYFRRAYNLMKKHFEKNYNFEINFSLAEIYLVKGKLNFAQKILNDIEECFENTKEIAHKQFYVIFYKLLINSRNQKNYEQFLNSEIFAKFLSNGDVIYVNKLKILYFTLIVNQINDLKVRPSRLKHIKNLVNLNYNSKNKIILFYLNQIPK